MSYLTTYSFLPTIYVLEPNLLTSLPTVFLWDGGVKRESEYDPPCFKDAYQLPVIQILNKQTKNRNMQTARKSA